MVRAALVLLASVSVAMIATTSVNAQHRSAHVSHAHHHQAAPRHSSAPIPITLMHDHRRNVVFVPVIGPYRRGPVVSLAPDQPKYEATVRIQHQRKAIEPLSFNSIAPSTIVSRTPSGSVVLTPARAFAGYHGHHRYAPRQTRYAPPAFHIIGDASGKHMSKPVKLTHGIKPRRGLRTEPKVVFLNAKD